MATNTNNLEPEFDALLKAHVKQHANVAVCAQFDPDVATAYLEQAMSNAAQTAFESHLAACVACRRHLIELSRLMPAPVSAAEPVVVHPTFNERWREWLSGWRLGALAGLGAVTATVLLVAVVVDRNSSKQVALRTAAGPNEVQVTPSPKASARTLSGEIAVWQEKTPDSASPATSAPLLKSKEAVKDVPTEPAVTNSQPQPDKDALAAAPPPPPPPVATPAPSKTEAERKEVTAQSPTAGASQIGNFRAQTPSGPASNQMQAERALEQRKREAQAGQQTADSVAPATKPPSKSAELAEERIVEKPKSNRTDEEGKKQPAAKAAPRPAPTAMMERATRFPERVVSGKTFRQENGVWIDEAYAANRHLPLVRLTRDNDEYKQTLKDTPALKPYFDLKPVVVVWQGKVYRVENK